MQHGSIPFVGIWNARLGLRRDGNRHCDPRCRRRPGVCRLASIRDSDTRVRRAMLLDCSLRRCRYLRNPGRLEYVRDRMTTVILLILASLCPSPHADCLRELEDAETWQVALFAAEIPTPHA